MTRGVVFGSAATFTELMKQFEDITGKDSKGGRHLRLANAESGARLYTHDPDKWHGLDFGARREKHAQAFEFVKKALSDQFGEEAAQRLLKAANLDGAKSITIGDMRKRNDELESIFPAGIGNCYFSDQENESIAQALMAMFDGSGAEPSGDALDPQYERDSHRQSKLFTKGGETFDLQQRLMEMPKEEQVPASRASMHRYVRVDGESLQSTRSKAFRASRLLNQETVAFAYMEVIKRTGYEFLSPNDLQKTEFHTTRSENQKSYSIEIDHKRFLTHFTDGDKKVALDSKKSFLAIKQVLSVTSEFLERKSKTGLVVVATHVTSNFVLDPSGGMS